MTEHHSDRTGLVVVGIGIALVACCLCIAALVVCAWGIVLSDSPRPTRATPLAPRATPLAPRATPTPGPRITPTLRPQLPTPSSGLVPPSGLRREPVPPEALDAARLFESAAIPKRDLRDVALRLTDHTDIPQITRDKPWDLKVGDKHSFWVSTEDTHENHWITATLIYVTPHLYTWLEDSVKVNQGKVKAAADRFENKTYPTDRQFFGSEWSPGVDSDVHLSLLISDKLGQSVAGYYSSMDEYSHLVNKYSNEMEMFYIHATNSNIGTSFFDCVMAHEFQHMIHWYHHQNQANWINEGLSELACQINGLETGGNMYAFADKPNTQLNSWPDETGTAGPNYGAAYLFMSYFLDRFGDKATQGLVNSTAYDLAAVDDVLSQTATGLTFNDVFADWTVANYINDPNVDQGQYSYTTIAPPKFKTTQQLSVGNTPTQKQAAVRQYGTDYYELTGSGNAQVDFAGATVVNLANTTAHSGKYVWWGAAANSTDTTLTREFDLTSVKSATMTFWTWYDIESDFDYAYVEASLDGKRWQTLPGVNTTNTDPNGANYGNGFTSKSGVPSSDKKTPAKWIQEKVDLSAYAGKKVQIRFEYITDAGVTHTGFYLDDIEIADINYRYDVDSGEGGWLAQGFVRHANVLPQQWLVQLISVSQDHTTVERLPIANDQTGHWNIGLGPEVERAVLVISGTAPITTEPAEYWFAATPK